MSWRTFELPWVIDTQLPEEADPHFLNGRALHWEGIRIDQEICSVSIDRSLFPHALCTQRLGVAEVDQIIFTLFQYDGIMVTFTWDVDGTFTIEGSEVDPADLASRPVPSRIFLYLDEAAEDPVAVVMGLIRRSYPGRTFSFTRRDLAEFLGSKRYADCERERCTGDPAQCKGPTCTFLRSMGEDPAIGYQPPEHYADPDVDNAQIREWISTAAFRGGQDMPES